MAFASKEEVEELRKDHTNLFNETSKINSTVMQIQTDMQTLQIALGNATTAQNQGIAEFEDKIMKMMQLTRDGMDVVVKEATKKFDEQEADIKGRAGEVTQQAADLKLVHEAAEAKAAANTQALLELHQKAENGWMLHQVRLDKICQDAEASLQNLQMRVIRLEQSPPGLPGATATAPSFDRNRNSYMPMKSLIPSTMSDKTEEWRRWRNKLAIYVDNCVPGMKEFLKILQEADEAPTDKDAEKHATKINKAWPTEEKEKLYRCLSELTAGEAQRVVEAVRNEDGYRAWYELHRNFEPSLKGKHGQAYTNLSELTKHKAKDVVETRKLLNELTTRIKLAEDLTNETVSQGHARSILLSFLDDKTREHTVEFHGSDKEYVDFKNAVLKFVNNTALGSGSSRAVPMQIGAVTENEEPAAPQEAQRFAMTSGNSSGGGSGGGSEDEGLWAIKGGGQVCWSCGGKGHIQRECPSKGGKGKGGGLGGKGSQGGFGYGGKGGGLGGFPGFLGIPGKGKGKGGFQGTCHQCGKWGHSAKYCYQKGGGKGPGKGGKGGSIRMLDGLSEWDAGPVEGWGQWMSLARIDEENFEDIDAEADATEEPRDAPGPAAEPAAPKIVAPPNKDKDEKGEDERKRIKVMEDTDKKEVKK